MSKVWKLLSGGTAVNHIGETDVKTLCGRHIKEPYVMTVEDPLIELLFEKSCPLCRKKYKELTADGMTTLVQTSRRKVCP